MVVFSFKIGALSLVELFGASRSSLCHLLLHACLQERPNYVKTRDCRLMNLMRNITGRFLAAVAKGQIISEQICGVLKFSKKATKYCQDFCPSL